MVVTGVLGSAKLNGEGHVENSAQESEVADVFNLGQVVTTKVEFGDVGYGAIFAVVTT